MALRWHTRTVPLSKMEEDGSPQNWEPFAIVEDDEGTPLCILRTLIEVEDEKSSVVQGSIAQLPEEDE